MDRHRERQLSILERRLASVENSAMFRAARWLGGGLGSLRARLRPPSGALSIPPDWYREYKDAMGSPPGGGVPDGYRLVTGPNDTLVPGAVHWMAEAARRTRAGLVYSDHESAGQPVFKPGWSPELRACCDYVGSTHLASDSGRENVAHVPRVLWRTSAPPPAYTPTAPRGPFPRASIVVCSRNEKLLAACLESLESTRYPDWEVVSVLHHIRPTLPRRARGIPYQGGFHWSRMNNLGVRASLGELVVMLNDDVAVVEPDWLALLASHAVRAEVAAVGAKLVYPGGAIQHVGVAVGMMDGCGHPGRGQFATPSWPFTNMTRNVSAVTGACLAVRREVFDKLGGFDDAFPVNYNDVDFCLRALEAGYRNVVEPRAVLRHDECRTRVRGTLPGERDAFLERWGPRMESQDPFYPLAFRDDTEAIELRSALEIERLRRG